MEGSTSGFPRIADADASPASTTPRNRGASPWSNWPGCFALGRDWGAIVLLAYLGVRSGNLLVYLAVVWLIGSFQFAIGECLLHEASHYHLFRNRSWNDRLEFLYALPFFMTVAQFRDEHMAHHRDAGTPEDNLLIDYRLLNLYRPRLNVFWTWFLKPIIGFGAYFYLTKLSLKPLRCGLKLVTFWTLVLGIALYLHAFHILVLYWLIPLWWAHVTYLYWSEIQDHFATRSGTRSVTGWLSNFLWHNNGYHAVHHVRPGLPWYRLPRAHRESMEKFDARDISSGFFCTYRQLCANIRRSG